MKEHIEFLSRVSEITSNIRYERADTWLHVGRDDTRLYLQVQGRGACAVSGDPLEWHGRKWLLSPHMTTSEIVSTAFKAYLTAEEHECRERFTYKGTRVFGPHFDVDSIVEALESRVLSESVRTEVKP